VATVAHLLQVPPECCIMVGDRLETDIQMGLSAGRATCLVLTGDVPRLNLAASGLEPTLVLNQI